MMLLDHIRNGRWDEVSEFMEEHLFAGMTNEDRSTILTELSFHGVVELIDKLLQSDADPNYRFDGVRGELSYDLEPGTTPLGQTILGAAWKRNQTLNTLNHLLAARANPNGITYSGYTPLQLAIVFGQQDLAIDLLEAGADPYCPSADLDKPDAFEFAADKPWAMTMLEKWKSKRDARQSEAYL